MTDKKRLILKTVIVGFILSAGISAYVNLWKNVNFGEILPDFLNFLTSSDVQQFISDNSSSAFFYIFVISIMALCYKHNRKAASKGLMVDDGFLEQKPDFNSDPINCNVSGNSYYIPKK